MKLKYIYLLVGEFILLKGDEEVVHLIIEIIQQHDPKNTMLEVNKWEMISGKLDNSKVDDKNFKIVKEINQKNKFFIINIDECINIAYILSPFLLKETKYSNCIGMENIFVAKHYIKKKW